MSPSMRRRELRLHGHPVAYYAAGSGPVLLLIHGITSSADAWRDVAEALARDHTVVAPDLLGHGGSAKPRGDYSLGAYASGLRDLMAALGHERATVVGHSMGGGVAMQLAYQFPERVERLALVSSGGLGREVGFALRAATLPGAEWVLPWLVRRGPSDVLDPTGQRVSATDRLYLAEGMPTLIVWGERDPMIPADHGRAAHAAIPHSRLELFPDAGHYPFADDPARFVAVLTDFVATTEPSVYDEEAIRRRLREGAPIGVAA
jgi:pimeloyl-ACP methyl ester carboxylesterase